MSIDREKQLLEAAEGGQVDEVAWLLDKVAVDIQCKDRVRNERIDRLTIIRSLALVWP